MVNAGIFGLFMPSTEGWIYSSLLFLVEFLIKIEFVIRQQFGMKDFYHVL